jgi:hypothetical protein
MTAKEKSTMTSHGIIWENVLLQVYLTRAVLNICTASRHSTPVNRGTGDRRESVLRHGAVFATTEISEKGSVSTGSHCV